MEERIVHGDDQRGGGRQGGFDLLASGGEEGLGLGAALAVETVVGGPILMLAALGGEQAGEGMAAQRDELRQGMGRVASGLGGGGEGTVQEGGQVGEEGRFFLSGMGSGGTTWRARMKWPLSAMVHSSCSPGWKSRAWAMGRGKLM